MNKFHDESLLTRYFRLIRYLNHPKSIRDIMFHFEISRRQVYRMLESLQNAGVVIEKNKSIMFEDGRVVYKVKEI